MARVSSIGCGQGGGSIRVGVETGFEEMGVEGLGVGRETKFGACFEESGEGEGMKGRRRRRVEVREEGKCFFVEAICNKFCE